MFCPQKRKAVAYFRQHICHPDGTKFKYRRCGNSSKLKLTFVVQGMEESKEPLIQF
jgi:hypothetical protein